MQFVAKDKVNSILAILLLVSFSAGLYFSYRATVPVSAETIVAEFSKKLNSRFENLTTSVKAFQQTDTMDIHRLDRDGSIEFLLLSEQEAVQWTGNQFLPPLRFVLDDFTYKYLKIASGDFLLFKWELDQQKFLVAIIPLHIHYKIQNEYLEPLRNADVFGRHEVQILDANAEQGYAVEINGTPIFKCILSPTQFPSANYAFFTILFYILAIILFSALLYRSVRYVRLQHAGLSFLVLLGGVVLVRYLMIEFQFPSGFVSSAIFDPKYFASSELNPSLGDLLLNSVSVTLLCLFLFRNFYRFRDLRASLKSPISRWMISVFSVLAILFGALFPYVVIQTIYNNSSITLNISESIRFDTLRILALLSVILSWISAFLFMHVFIRLLMGDSRVKYLLSLLIGIGLFIWINESTGQLYISSLVTGLIYILIVGVFKLYKSLQHFRYLTFTYFFTAVVFFAFNGLLAISHFSKTERVVSQLKFANSFLIDKDDFGEFLLAETMEKIAGDFFIQSRLSGPFTNREAVRQKVRQVFIPGYFNKYTIDIHLYGATGEPLDDRDTENFTTWITHFDDEASQTSYEGIYFFNRPDEESARKYLVVIPVKRGVISAGYVILELSLKRVIPENVYPGLLVDNRFRQAFGSQEFSNAVFTNNQIQYWSGDFNYTGLDKSVLDDSRLYKSGLEFSNYLHIASRDASGRIVLVSSLAPSLTYTLADFSLLIILGLFSILIFLLTVGIIDFFRVDKLMLSTRIQLILNLAFFIPLIAVSVITLGLTARSNQEQLNADYLAKSRSFTNQISSLFIESDQGDGMSGDLNFTQLSKLANLDANLFTPSGKLQFTTQPLIFENQLLSPYINPAALDRIKRGDRVFIADEQVGTLNYFVAYSALLAPDDGSLIGVLGIPFFQAESFLERMQITVLANILSIFTAIFIVLVIVSFWVAQWLTFPLRMITQKLGRISLTHTNQPLEWQSDDEIGLMVREYNQMLSTLSESKSQLERVQREKAWREIAQQVAHEIKNPLTPMKLMLQQTERLPDADPKTLEKIRRAIASILDQVDTLDGIASSFSAFAKMPEPVMRTVELVGLLKKVVHLHNQSATIELTTELDRVDVQVDEQLISRIFSNIILNGIQAAREGTPPKIQVHLMQKGNSIHIAFADNGTGIKEHLKDKIFLPHFSTKQSGSGLGLAIARQGIEQMGGKIYFESRLNNGSVFYVELPLLKPDK
ncbi:MAG: GHKL domain-containing protein [Cyclobacteriaceae bacterium]|nr:GHKL domain-containing protein [Cyclobacteriaceae bacterium]